MKGDAAQCEKRVSGVDRLRDTVHGPESGPVTTLTVAVLDVVVDQAEVVAEFHGSSSGQCRPVVACNRGIREQSEKRAYPLAGRTAAVEPEVVTDHLVKPGRGGIALRKEAQDLPLGIGDQIG